MIPRENIERIFMACSARDEKAEQRGPFKTAEEAEAQTRKLNWGWVLVYTHVVDGSGKIIDVQKRFYEPAKPQRMGAAEVKRLLSTPDPKPMNHEEMMFFAPYELQLAEGKKRTNG